MKTDWKKSFIEEFAGHPIRVALNLFIIGSIGILLGHFAFGMEPTSGLIIGSMLPALAAVVSAGQMKAQAEKARR